MKRVKTWMVVLVILAAVVGAGAAPAKTGAAVPGDELRAQAEQFAAAWDRDDAKAMAAQWTEDGDLINPFGRMAKGRSEVEKLFQDEHSTFTKGTRFTIKEISTRMVRPDLAAEDWQIELSGGQIAPDPAKPLVHHIFALATKQGGHWKFVAVRAYIYQTPPPAGGGKP